MAWNYLRRSQVFFRNKILYTECCTLLKLCIFNDTVNVFLSMFYTFYYYCVLKSVCYNAQPLRLSVFVNKGTTYLLTYWTI